MPRIVSTERNDGGINVWVLPDETCEFSDLVCRAHRDLVDRVKMLLPSDKWTILIHAPEGDAGNYSCRLEILSVKTSWDVVGFGANQIEASEMALQTLIRGLMKKDHARERYFTEHAGLH